jgi:hypothetical protein
MNHSILKLAACAVITVFSAASARADDALPDNDVIMRAMVDEITRSMELQLEDLEKPYFIQYTVDDAITYQLSGSYGALTDVERDRSRDFRSHVRVGSYELDNTNFAGGRGGFFGFGGMGGGGRASLPIEDDYLAMRQAMWRATDADYKDAVETLTKKRAYMRDKTFDDRPNDFTKAEPAEHIEPATELVFDRAAWESRLERLSGYFKDFDWIQDSSVRLFVGAGNTAVVNSEGTRVRTGDAGALLVINADVQAEDGMKLSDSLLFTADRASDLPDEKRLREEIETLAQNLKELMNAPILEQYTGPVLLDGLAAGQMFRQLLAEGIAGRPEPVGTQRRGFDDLENLQKKLGRRIMPRSFRVYDDPTVKSFGGETLMGHYRYDDEGVKAQRVQIVTDGKLVDMVMSRAPIEELSGSNGHGRSSPGGGQIEAAVGCLFIEDEKGLSEEELKAELIEAAADEGLEYGLRIKSLRAPGITSSQSDMLSFFMRMQRRGSGPSLGDPVYAYKVYVEDGREELVRGIEFAPVQVRALRDLVAAGKEQTVYNYVGIGFTGQTPPTSIITPAVLFEELELSEIEQEHERLPILKAPLTRDST